MFSEQVEDTTCYARLCSLQNDLVWKITNTFACRTCQNVALFIHNKMHVQKEHVHDCNSCKTNSISVTQKCPIFGQHLDRSILKINFDYVSPNWYKVTIFCMLFLQTFSFHMHFERKDNCYCGKCNQYLKIAPVSYITFWHRLIYIDIMSESTLPVIILPC